MADTPPVAPTIAPAPARDTTREELAAALADPATPAPVRAAYARVDGAPTFVRTGSLTPAGTAALAIVQAAAAEAIDPASIGLEALNARVAFPDARLEIQLATSLHLWANAQWPGNPHRQTAEQRAEGVAPDVGKRTQDALGSVLERGPDDADGVRAALVAMRPPNAQYERLIPVLARYERIVADGGWETEFASIPRPARKKFVRYSPKGRVPGKLIPAIKRRLHAEGYYAPDDDEDAWNDDFEAAVLSYRTSHQLWERTWIDYELRESLLLPAQFRVIQIKLALERMRRSRVGDDKLYVHVVVPSFHAEVWENGAQLQRFRVIVGGRQRYRDRDTGEWVFINATPLFSDRIETVILNPYWTVPPRLKRDLEKEQEKDPTYYAKNGYEVIGSSLRQKPGPKNALGKVKFLFPNDESVYMHDTPRKDLFRAPVRAYSHGCMRVQEPLDFAWFLLSREGREDLTERRIRRNAFGGGHFRYNLKHGPRIHIEYWTVRVDDNGMVEFLEDIYLHDSREARDRFGLDLGNLK